MPKVEKYDHGRVVAYRDWIPKTEFHAVEEDVSKQDNRKRIYLLRTPQVPDSIKSLGRTVSSRLGVQPNVAISKRYSIDDTYVSKAYSLHVDPSEWHRQDLITCSIGGLATLSFLDQDGAITEILLEPNTMIRMKPDVYHMVSPPLDNDPRHVIFFGRSPILR